MKSTLYFVSGVRPSKLKELMEWNDKRQGQLHLFFSLFFQRQEKRRKVELLWLMAQQTQIKENFFSLIVCGARGGQLSSINLINESKDICFIEWLIERECCRWPSLRSFHSQLIHFISQLFINGS